MAGNRDPGYARSPRLHRREFLGVILAGLMAPPRAAGSTVTTRAGNRPNIVLIMADDMGFSDVGCYGGEVATPNIDALAAGGLRFTQFYNTARCCPTRASLLTGLYPHQAGIGHMTNEEDRRFDYGHPAYRGELNRRCVTLAEALRPAGYHTWMAGKWHVGTAEGLRPLDRGFERYYGIVRGASNYWKPDPDKLLMDGRTAIPDPGEGFYTTDAFTDNAIRFIEEQHDEDPFFLYLAYTSPHWPLHAPADIVARYRGKYRGGWDQLREERLAHQHASGLLEKSVKLTPRDEAVPAWEEVPVERREVMDHRMAIYAAQIERMDWNIGRVVETLRRRGQIDNTLILFLSDNGGCAEGGVFGGGKDAQLGTKEGYFLTYGPGWANASNTPFRRYKHWVHEGGISTPLIAHWPDGIPAERRGSFTRQYGHLIDFMPTFLDLAGGTYPAEYGGNAITPVEGKSLVPLLRGQEAPIHDAIFWEHEGNSAVRRGKWKLVSAHRRKGRQWELYDIEADRSETENLIEAQPEIAKELQDLYAAWAERCGVLPWPVKPPSQPKADKK